MSACPCEFPEQPALGCAVTLGRMVLANSLLNNKAEALKHAGCLIGSIGHSFDGTDPTPFGDNTYAEVSAEAREAGCDLQNLEDCASLVVSEGESREEEENVAYGANPLLAIALRRMLQMALGRLLAE